MQDVPASVRNVQSVKHPESSEIILVIGRDHYGISLLVVGHKGRIVDFDNGIADRVHICELLLESSCLVDKDDIPCTKVVLGQAGMRRGLLEYIAGYVVELHTRSEIIIVAIIGPRVKERVPRVRFDEIVSGERRSSE